MNAKVFSALMAVAMCLTLAVVMGIHPVRRWGPHSPSVELGYGGLDNATRAYQFALNRAFPDVEITDVNGVRHSLTAERGKIVVLLVQGDTCPCSAAYVDRVNAIARDYAARGVEIWAFNPNANETEPQTRAFVKAHKVEYAVAYDKGNKLADLLHAACTTECWVADRNGLLRYHGRIDDSTFEPDKVKVHDLRLALDAILAGKRPPYPETRAFACRIQRVGDQ
jgi:peroxiredoxin